MGTGETGVLNMAHRRLYSGVGMINQVTDSLPTGCARMRIEGEYKSSQCMKVASKLENVNKKTSFVAFNQNEKLAKNKMVPPTLCYRCK